MTGGFVTNHSKNKPNGMGNLPQTLRGYQILQQR